MLTSSVLATSTLLVSETAFTYIFLLLRGERWLMYKLFVMKTLVTNPAIIEAVAKMIKVT